jgi:type II secretory ATPase GspE/PulE/Tfp pilus assembly ATPase PilB-like protein
MPSDFPSIADITKKSTSPSRGGTSAQAKFSQKMEEIALKEREELTAAVAAGQGLPHVDLAKFPVSSEALRAVPQDIAESLKAVCFYFTPSELRLGVVEPTAETEQLAQELVDRFHAKVATYLISEHSFERMIKLYANLPIVKPVTKDINITDEELNRYALTIKNLQTLQEQFQAVSITDILTLMIASAIKVNASDIHVEAEEGGIKVRYRIDGVLQDVATLPKEQWKRFVSRIKLLAALKINVTDRPQDGRVTLRLEESSLDVRVSTMPTIHGESVVMRILHSGTKGVTFDELGLLGDAYARLKHEVERPTGMIITTGPTGSGKTTTLYAILRTLNQPDVKIITLEDPIEIKMEGVNQSQVDPSRDYTFAKGLRSILRQDPDICMVGEIRDLETAEIAIQAALTGHLMLSTIHTNSAAGALPRFLSMGVKPFLLAPALNSIIGQRLVRRICSNCIEPLELDAEAQARVQKVLETLPPNEKSKLPPLQFYHGKGCEECSGLGYKGRIGIYEIFIMSKELEAIILSNSVSEYKIQELALSQGMVTMVQDGLLKALNKVTTVEEVFRVTE